MIEIFCCTYNDITSDDDLETEEDCNNKEVRVKEEGIFINQNDVKDKSSDDGKNDKDDDELAWKKVKNKRAYFKKKY